MNPKSYGLEPWSFQGNYRSTHSADTNPRFAQTTLEMARVHHENNRTVQAERENKIGVGLHNEGNICYLNALLQSFYHVKEIQTKLLAMTDIGDQAIHMSCPQKLKSLFS
jgi:ubiquitin C-terminal hydrolase